MKTGASFVIVALAIACAADPATDNVRSPKLDYPPPEPQSSDGRPMGADEQPPGERLERNARIRNRGADLAPGWTVHDGELEYDEEQKGGEHISGD
jgi:hypothetical protein